MRTENGNIHEDCQFHRLFSIWSDLLKYKHKCSPIEKPHIESSCLYMEERIRELSKEKTPFCRGDCPWKDYKDALNDKE
jgi:hypothetical protein